MSARPAAGTGNEDPQICLQSVTQSIDSLGVRVRLGQWGYGM
jgi:hypothetical protein